MVIENDNVVRFQYAHLCCKICDLRESCPANRDNHNNLASSSTPRSRTLRQNDYLFRQGNALKALYVIRSGSLKGDVLTPKGLKQVIRFYLPGELVGLDALADNRHMSSAQALEISSVCCIGVDTQSESSPRGSALQRQLLKLASRGVAIDEWEILVAQSDAGKRLAAFLLSLSQRYTKRGLSPCEFNLSMSRADIGNLLGLAVETVSRLFTQFQRIGLISADRRHVRLLSIEGLREIVDHECLLIQ